MEDDILRVNDYCCCQQGGGGGTLRLLEHGVLEGSVDNAWQVAYLSVLEVVNTDD